MSNMNISFYTKKLIRLVWKLSFDFITQIIMIAQYVGHFEYIPQNSYYSNKCAKTSLYISSFEVLVNELG